MRSLVTDTPISNLCIGALLNLYEQVDDLDFGSSWALNTRTEIGITSDKINSH